MIRAVYRAEGDRFSLSAAGHATGSVQACAAVSGLFYALAGYLEKTGAAVSVLRLESGDARVEASGGAAVRAAFEMAAEGLRLAGEAVPGALVLEGKGVASDGIRLCQGEHPGAE